MGGTRKRLQRSRERSGGHDELAGKETEIFAQCTEGMGGKGRLVWLEKLEVSTKYMCLYT